jgi:hypothetical protein
MAGMNKGSRMTMNRRRTTPLPDPDDHKVYVGALVPLTLYSRLVEEAEATGVSRSEVLRRALAERYSDSEAG